jgi:hypothetical protein
LSPLDTLTAQQARALRGFTFDLDDTLLDHGRLTEVAFAALHRLVEAGLELYGITGRPAGWADVLTRLLPLRGVVAENGALASVRRGERVVLLDSVSAAERARRTQRLDTLITEFSSAFGDFEPTDDQRARISDRTFDIGEHRQVPPERVERASTWLRQHGARCFTSSVHLHATFDQSDKASGAVRLLSELSGLDETEVLGAYAFIGDSENDASCFAAFRLSIGVSNLRGRPTLRPRFSTHAARGAGFAEAAQRILRLREVSDKSPS